MTRDQKYLLLARSVAFIFSKDPSTKVGAVLVGLDPRDVAIGYNGFPPRIHDYDARLEDREVRHLLTVHAERNVLDNAHFPTRGGTMYATFHPCHECAKSIISMGIARVVVPPTQADDRHARWAESMGVAKELFLEAGVRVDEVGE